MNIIEKAMKLGGSAPAARDGASIIVEAVAAASQVPAQVSPVPPPAESPAAAARALVDFTYLARSGFFGPEGEDPRLLAEIRHLKRSVIRAASAPMADARPNIIAVTSALPEAGKTYLAASLAQSITLERDRSALLIDGDDVRCSLSKALRQHGQVGFFDLLHDNRIDADSMIMPTDLRSLQFMPCGGRFADSAELLASRRANEVAHHLSVADPNRLIIIDCPPLLGTPNGAALAALAGQVLVVVEAGVTDTSTLTKALELLGRERPIGLVLNKVPRSGLLSSRVGSYYYYGARDEG